MCDGQFIAKMSRMHIWRWATVCSLAPSPCPSPRITVWTGDMGNRCSETWVTLFGQTAHFFERSVTGALEGGIGHVSSP